MNRQINDLNATIGMWIAFTLFAVIVRHYTTSQPMIKGVQSFRTDYIIPDGQYAGEIATGICQPERGEE